MNERKNYFKKDQKIKLIFSIVSKNLIFNFLNFLFIIIGTLNNTYVNMRMFIIFILVTCIYV